MKRIDSISETASYMEIRWSENDYFVMPDVALQPYPAGKEIHLGFYVLFICVTGEVEMILNNVSTKIEPFCLYALSPGNIITPKMQSEDCRLRALCFTKDFC